MVFGDEGHCSEYTGILDRYQGLLRDHEGCLRSIGDDRATIKNYENLISHGLEKQINEIKNRVRNRWLALFELINHNIRM